MNLYTATMRRYYGKLLGVIAGALLLRANPLFGGLIGLLVGHAFDADWFRSAKDNPWRVLGLSEDANPAEVDAAYRRLISQYHPDKFASVAPELQRQAEAKARAINAAYDRIQSLRKRER